MSQYVDAHDLKPGKIYKFFKLGTTKILVLNVSQIKYRVYIQLFVLGDNFYMTSFDVDLSTLFWEE